MSSPISCNKLFLCHDSGADPGFPIGGVDPFCRGGGPLMWALFGENVCENERIGPWGARARKFCM